MYNEKQKTHEETGSIRIQNICTALGRRMEIGSEAASRFLFLNFELFEMAFHATVTLLKKKKL